MKWSVDQNIDYIELYYYFCIVNALCSRLLLFDGIKKDGSFISQASSFGRRHPVFALWSVSLKKELFDAIKFSQIRKIDAFTEKYKTSIIDFEQRPDPFLNINKPEDIKVAKRELNLT